MSLASRLATLEWAVQTAERQSRELQVLAEVPESGSMSALFHEAEVLEVSCTDTLLELDVLLDALEVRQPVRALMDRMHAVAATLGAVKMAARG